MESMSPTLNFCCLLIRNIESSRSILFSINEYIAENQDELSDYLVILHKSWLKQASLPAFPKEFSIYRISLIEALWSGLQGRTIYTSLLVLRDSILEQCKLEMDQFISRLPFLLLLPLMFLQVPAFLILLFGPILQEFARSL